MEKINGGNKSLSKLLNMKSIIIALILVILILSLLANFMMLGKLSRITENLNSQDKQQVSKGSDSSSASEQEQELYIKMNPVLYNIRHLRRQIIDREVIKDDSMIGVPIDNQIKEDIKEYNKLVAELKGFFAERAIRTLIGVFQLTNEDGGTYRPNALNYLEIPSDVREYAEVIAGLSLYRNCTELLCNDSRLAFIISSEGGGSAGMWPYLWHTEYLRDFGHFQEDLNRLFDLVERIITSLDREYENFNYMAIEQRFPVSQ